MTTKKLLPPFYILVFLLYPVLVLQAASPPASAAKTGAPGDAPQKADKSPKKADEPEENTRINYFSAAGGMEISGQSPSGASFNLVYLGDFRIHKNFSFGVKGGFYFASENVFSIETLLFGRWYFSPILADGVWWRKMFDIFAQAGVGTDAFFKDNEPVLSRALPVFDLSAGARIPLPSHFYLEPFIRGGYPSLFGAGVILGFRFPSFGTGVRVEKTYSTNEIIKRIVISQVEYIVFGADISQVNAGIDATTQVLNTKAIEEVAKVLKSNPAFRVRIEGYANPVRNTADEKPRLLRLSLARSRAVEAKLVALGVSLEQIVVAAHGTDRATVNANLNRRVELMVIQVEE
jgi:hypothetical protein